MDLRLSGLDLPPSVRPIRSTQAKIRAMRPVFLNTPDPGGLHAGRSGILPPMQSIGSTAERNDSYRGTLGWVRVLSGSNI